MISTCRGAGGGGGGAGQHPLVCIKFKREVELMQIFNKCKYFNLRCGFLTMLPLLNACETFSKNDDFYQEFVFGSV
jgi:hypothetical protein